MHSTKYLSKAIFIPRFVCGVFCSNAPRYLCQKIYNNSLTRQKKHSFICTSLISRKNNSKTYCLVLPEFFKFTKAPTLKKKTTHRKPSWFNTSTRSKLCTVILPSTNFIISHLLVLVSQTLIKTSSRHSPTKKKRKPATGSK